MLGAGTYIYNASPTIKNCLYTNNNVYKDVSYSSAYGSAIYAGPLGNETDARIIDPEPVLLNNIFADNGLSTNQYTNGTVYLSSCGDVVVQDCLFENNCAKYRPGIYAESTDSIVVDRCVFHDNYAFYMTTPTCWFYNIDSLQFTNNVVDEDGVNGSYNTVTGVYVDDCEYSDIIHNTFIECNSSASNNTETCLRIFSYYGSTFEGDVNVHNNIFWGDTALSYQVYIEDNDPSGGYDDIVVSYNDIRGGQGAIYSEYSGGYTWGSGNINSDPLLNRLWELSTEYSPCVDAGDKTLNVTTLDFRGDARTDWPTWPMPPYPPKITDMGADEFNYLEQW